MHIDVNTLIAQYGYWALFIGCLAEGETFTLLGGVAAHEGLLHYGGVILAAMCGGMLGDCALFFIGRHFGETILQRFNKHRQHIARANRLIRNRPVLFVIGVRFMYGLRIVGPIIIGASKLSPRQFLLCNLTGAALWATLFVTLGYLAGQMIAPWLHQLEQYLKPLFWLLLILAVVWGIRIAIKKRAKS
ncbi:DedA family protein [Erwinia pyrifoliae]|uniref:DedA family protein n=1 Tax=Erwinia pyrifoliae TaxID=79967 RepID=A0ABY5X574_ERWPY|nr:DedA family protein [Erwinia pyrifoliae]MCT2388425.1 DedA family protein [Erwinia pyrifoliae]MCU8586594.1 DedA family protein [Erwinia pyrifoliae]UWS32297.1 DedA family protein [Erwinia pyrifoliae]